MNIKKTLYRYGIKSNPNLIRAYWWSGEGNRNFGDVLTPYLIEKISGKKAILCSKHCFKPYFMVTGSILKSANRNSIVWGSGIIRRNEMVTKPKKIFAVRGPITRKRLLELGYDCPEVYGDPALLLPLFYKPKATKKYSLGVIPNHIDYKLAKSKLSDKKILLIASDIARYGLNTPGESSQGAGAVGMILSANPRIIAFEPEYGVVTENVMDFWRPNYSDAAMVDGKYSSKLYLNMLEQSWRQYYALSKRRFEDHAGYCYHTPVPKLVEKAHHLLAKINGQEKLSAEKIQQQIGCMLEYGRKIGNSYTASLYVGLISLLDLTKADLTGTRLGFYSYGSGCVAEYFSGLVEPGYRNQLNSNANQHMLSTRIVLTYPEYEAFYCYSYPEDGSYCEIPSHETGQFRLAAIENHKRIYTRCT